MEWNGIRFKKYGEELGLKIWQDRQEKWAKTLIENGNLKGGYSLISQELFEKISNYYESQEDLYFAKGKLNNEYYISTKEYGYKLYDFVDLNSRKIIEFNGDLYHANPKIYQENDITNPFKGRNKTAKEIWEDDKIKIKIANDRRFEVLVIWESEYRKNPIETLNKCLDFLKK